MPPFDNPSLIDSHCHLDSEIWQEDLPDVINRAEAAGVTTMVTIGSDDSVAYAQRAVALAQTRANIFATVGIHPHNAADCDASVFESISELAHDPNVVGIGETGLDYHYDLSPRDTQKTVFRQFISLAKSLDKALVIHVRDAFEDCIQIMKEEDISNCRTIIHCFSGSNENAKAFLDLGCWISIPGIVTFKKSGDIPNVAATVPNDKLLIETDCPYLAPVPFRGKRNEPSYLVHTAEFIANLRGLSIEDLASLTNANTRDVYRLP